jgi:hypothetical protein
MDKYIKDGKVAVLVSHGFGAWWSTWNSDYDELIFDPELIKAVLENKQKRIISRAKEICPDGYFGGIDGLTIEWVPEGEKFEITEYDGDESLNIISEQSYYTA